MCAFRIRKGAHKYFIPKDINVMKKTFCFLFASTLVLTSCSNFNEFYGAATGSSLGGMFGSAIGGLMGGPRGSDAGTIIGMVAGGVAGATVANRNEERTSPSYERSYNDEVGYDYTPQRHYSSYSYNSISVRNVTFNDENGNRSLDSRERAYIILDIYNDGHTDAYEIAPTITCDNRRVIISPTAIISSLGRGRGARYKAAVTTRGNLKNGVTRFNVSFDGGRTTAKTFTIQTRR